MPKLVKSLPKYSRHKPSGRAYVRIDGRFIYLGKYNSANSRAEYSRIASEWTASGGTLPEQHDLTVSELSAAFMRHATDYYRSRDGKPTSEIDNFKAVLRRLKPLYGRTRVVDFGPLALKGVRQQLLDDNLARNTINRAVDRIRHIFKWGVENQLVPPVVLQGLQAVAGLRAGRSKARETAPVKPVPDAFVDAVLPQYLGKWLP